MKPFTKVFQSIIYSSVWDQPDDVVRVWFTLMALADQDGVVHAAIGGLASASRKTREQTEKALAIFLAPDPDSRSPEYDGRRIEVINGGWRLLNYTKYRQMSRDTERREYLTGKQREYRRVQVSTPVDKCVPCGPIVEAEAEVEGEGETQCTPPLSEVESKQPKAVDILKATLRSSGLPCHSEAINEWRAYLTHRVKAKSRETACEFILWVVARGVKDGVDVKYPKHTTPYLQEWASKTRCEMEAI